MTSFRTRLLLALITLIFGVLVGLGLLLGQLFKTYYLNTLHSRVEMEMEIISDEVTNRPELTETTEGFLANIARTLQMNVTITRPDETILYSSTEGDVMDDPSVRVILSRYLQTGELTSRYQDNSEEVFYSTDVVIGGEPALLIVSTFYSDIERVYQQIWIILALCLGIALMIIILIGSRITSQYTKPIESATNVAIELAKGNYRARTYEDRVDETGMLSNAINVLARNLQEMVSNQAIQQDRLQTLIENMGSGLVMIDKQGFIVLHNRAYTDFFHVDSKDILNERYVNVMKERAVRKLAEEVFMTEQRVRKQLFIDTFNEKRHIEVYGAPIIGKGSAWQGIVLVFHDITELKKLEQMRKDFVANVSHEVKTPITSIKGFSETLLDGAMHDQEALSMFLNIILKESDRLQALIQDLLDLSKVEQQGFQLNFAPMNMAVLMEDVRSMMINRAEQKDVRIITEGPESLILDGDYDRLKQVLINLVGNAITYSHAGGTIELTWAEVGNDVQIGVRDHGIGMEQEEIPRIFERFYRVDKARSRNSGGTGLGLAIVKHIMEVHHGEIKIESGVNKGTFFTLILPKKALD